MSVSVRVIGRIRSVGVKVRLGVGLVLMLGLGLQSCQGDDLY